MSRFLIASWDGGGNTPSAFNLGSRLVRRGHRVRMLGWAAMAGRAASAGLDFGTYRTAPSWPDPLAHEDDWDLLTECLFGDACRADIVAEARAHRAGVLVVDCMLRAGFDAARELGLPAAALVHVSYQQFLHVWGDGALATDVRSMLAASEVVLALQPPGFDAPCPLPRGHEYVGAIGHPDATRRLDARLAATLASRGDPWVLLSMSTTTQRGQAAALQAILDVLATLPVRLLVTLGGAVTAAELDAPPNSTIVGFVPHELLLTSMAAVVTHAGMSTVATTLAAGVPMVCVPQGRDQGGNAERVAAIGAGLVADSGGVAGAVGRLIADGRHRAAARRIARASVPLGAGARATDLVEDLSRTAAAAVR